MIVVTQAKRASGMMTRATFLLNKERKVCYSAVYPRWSLTNIAVSYFDGQVRGEEPHGDGEAGGRRQGVGRSRGQLCN